MQKGLEVLNCFAFRGLEGVSCVAGGRRDAVGGATWGVVREEVRGTADSPLWVKSKDLSPPLTFFQ
jgi:hypothetical protein